MEDFVKRTVDVAIEDDIDFESLLLSPKVLSGLKAIGFDRPSPIQLQSIPLAKCGAGESVFKDSLILPVILRLHVWTYYKETLNVRRHFKVCL